MLRAVSQNGFALEYAKECLRIAITQNGSALQFASYGMRAKREVVIMALGALNEQNCVATISNIGARKLQDEKDEGLVCGSSCMNFD